jgi:hypothetical protein
VDILKIILVWNLFSFLSSFIEIKSKIGNFILSQLFGKYAFLLRLSLLLLSTKLLDNYQLWPTLGIFLILMLFNNIEAPSLLKRMLINPIRFNETYKKELSQYKLSSYSFRYSSIIEFLFYFFYFYQNTKATLIYLALASTISLILFLFFVNQFLKLKKNKKQILKRLKDENRTSLLYFSGSNNDFYQIRQWEEYLSKTDHNVFILFREHDSYATFQSQYITHKMIIPYNLDLSLLLEAPIRFIFYVNNGMKNVHMLRFFQLYHIQLLHGESDKAPSTNLIAQSYHKLCVAGEAAIDRYKLNHINIHEDRFVKIGRPITHQLKIQQKPSDNITKILYAPTWEEYSYQSNSSLLKMGLKIIRQLCSDFPQVKIYYKPHPRTGSLNKSFKKTHQDIKNFVLKNQGVVIEHDGKSMSLYDAFNETDLLITDISSTIADFLYTQKPFLVCNPLDLSDDDIDKNYPTLKGSYILDRDVKNLKTILRPLVEGKDERWDLRMQNKSYILESLPMTSKDYFIHWANTLLTKDKGE